MADLDFDAVGAKLAGVAGAALSMRYLRGSWPERVSMAVSGSVVSYYVGPHLSSVLGTPQELTGFLLGMFGMALSQRIWEAIQTIPLGDIWQALIKRIGG